jgi:ABC-type antimicrobial peptide transport system ATPase subunit
MKNPLANDIFQQDEYITGQRLIYLGQNTGMIKHLAKGTINKIERGYYFVKFSDMVTTQCTQEDLDMYFCREAMDAGEALAEDYDID